MNTCRTQDTIFAEQFLDNADARAEPHYHHPSPHPPPGVQFHVSVWVGVRLCFYLVSLDDEYASALNWEYVRLCLGMVAFWMCSTVLDGFLRVVSLVHTVERHVVDVFKGKKCRPTDKQVNCFGGYLFAQRKLTNIKRSYPHSNCAIITFYSTPQIYRLTRTGSVSTTARAPPVPWPPRPSTPSSL